MNGASKTVLWVVGVCLAGLGYWWYARQAASPAGEGNSAGDASGGGGLASSAQPDHATAQILDTLSDYATQAGILVGIVPKGIRNNNPGNLRFVASIPWKGQVGDDGTGYAVFDTAEDGVRALGHQLRTYLGRGVNSVTSIITTYAPSNENDTQAYIADVAQRVGVDPNQPLGEDALPALAQAIIHHENGTDPYGLDAITAWASEP